MATKPSESSRSKHGLNDVIGIGLLALALLLFVSQWSFDRYDLRFARLPPNKEIHNWIGTIGAYFAWFTFLPLGVGAYLLPWIFAAFGVAYLMNFLVYLRERLKWCLLWTFVLMISVTGLVHILDVHNLAGYARDAMYTDDAGGFLGRYSSKYGFCLLGTIGATIVYSSLGLISVLFLTDFQLGYWLRGRLGRDAEADAFKSADEIALEKRARELEKQKRKLEEQVGLAGKTEKPVSPTAGLGADGLPVPEPTVRDLSVP
ncbi:MAG: DNA translocase FtsK 4TM domain-containing protein, partial [Verrucomicrobiota bacterium]